jgi:hypothetical protein
VGTSSPANELPVMSPPGSYDRPQPVRLRTSWSTSAMRTDDQPEISTGPVKTPLPCKPTSSQSDVVDEQQTVDPPSRMLKSLVIFSSVMQGWDGQDRPICADR